MNKNNQRGFSSIVLIVVVAVVVVGGYFIFSKRLTVPGLNQQESQLNEEQNVEEGVQKGEVTAGKLTEISVAESLINGSHPKLSYDGTKIVYRRAVTKDNGLWIVNIDGSGLKKLTSDQPLGVGMGINDFGWSYDDKFIFYFTDLNLNQEGRGGGPVVINIVDIKTGDIKRLFQAPSGYNIRSLRWLGENQIAFILYNSSSFLVKVIDVRGESVEPLGDVSLYFWHTKESIESSVIASVDTHGTVKELSPSGATAPPSVAYKALKIAYSNSKGIVVMNSDGSNPKLILSNIGGGPEPLFSPDGEKLIYSKSKDDGHYITESDVYIINSDGSGEKRLTDSGKKFAAEPSWSADGKKIVFFYGGSSDKQIGILELE